MKLVVALVSLILYLVTRFIFSEWTTKKILDLFLFLVIIVAFFIFSFLPICRQRALQGRLRNQSDLGGACRVIEQYHRDHGRLPFGRTEGIEVATWRKANGRYEPVRFKLEDSLEGFCQTNLLLAQSKEIESALQKRNRSLEQFQIACISPVGVPDGARNGCAYAIATFGNGEKGMIPAGMGCAALVAYFPDVIATNKEGTCVRKYYKLEATWVKDDQGAVDCPIRFGFEPEPGVCMLIPPEAFKPGAVTKLRGDGPDSVEYWAKRLYSAPSGRWSILLNRGLFP